jgi:alpha-galactosidase
MTIRPVVVAVGVQLVSGETYCPTLGDFDIAWGSVSAEGNGWRVDGEGGVHGKTSWNLLGGSIQFDMDVCGAQTGVNNNFYTISPQGGPASGYCDIQTNDSPICMELDIIENNGKCLGRTTWHVWGNKDGGCDQNGCYGEYHIDDCKFHMRTEFGADGSLTQYRNGQVVQINGPSGSEKNQIVQNMQSTGASIASTQWTGWVPDDGSCGGLGDSNSFTFAVTNVVVDAPQGILFGPAPPTCSGPSPPPPPGPGPSWYKTITPSSNTNLCLDLPGDDASNGNQLWLWECNGQESQRWVFDNWQIRFGADESKCIDAGDMSDGMQLFLWDCNGYPQQTWGYDSDAARVYLASTSTCLDYYGDWQSSGQPLHVWDCTGDWNQEWSIWNIDPSPTPSPPPPPSPTPGPSPQCDCGWAASGCGSDDGSVCWHVCCGSHSAEFLV